MVISATIAWEAFASRFLFITCYIWESFPQIYRRAARREFTKKEAFVKRASLTIGLALALGIAAGVIWDRLSSAQQGDIERTVLRRSDLTGLKGQEGVMVLSEIAPGATVARHFHPGDELTYVLSGSGTMEVDGKPPLAFKQGDTYYHPAKAIHGFKNPSKTTPIKLLVFWIVPKGQPLTVPSK